MRPWRDVGQQDQSGRGAENGPAANREAANAFAANLLPVVRELQASGTTTVRAIAEALNARGIRTARGGDWHNSTVRNLLAREGSRSAARPRSPLSGASIGDR